MTKENQVNEIEVVAEKALQVVQDTKEFVVVIDEKGKYKRKAKYQDFSSINASSREDQIWLLNLLENSEDTGHGLKEHIGKEIVVENIITRAYDKINEDTGQTEYGVLTYLLTPEKVAYVTSSKNVYFTINKIMDVFGKPNTDEWKNITIRVDSEKGLNGTMVKIKMIG